MSTATLSRKEQARLGRHRSIRKKIFGTPERPRLAVHRSLKELYVQVIDDTKSQTLLSFSTQNKAFVIEAKGTKTEKAKKLGQFFSKRLLEKGIGKIAFDRGGYQYHGRIKALADALREGGLEF